MVFVEVKARTSLEGGLPSETVSEEKRSRYEKIAGWYLRDYEFVDIPIRFDIISIILPKNGEPTIEHIEDAFWV